MNIRMNQSRVATRRRIESAFLLLFSTKSFREMTVAEVCELADVNRSTFYENYSDLPALAQEVCRSIETTVSELPHEKHEYAWLFEYVSANREIFTAYFRLAMPPEAEDYQSAFRRRGIYAVVKAWFENGCQESAEHMSQLLQKLIHKT